MNFSGQRKEELLEIKQLLKEYAAVNGSPVLFAYDFDLERIKRFKTGLALFRKQGYAVCFDFQADCLGQYLDRTAQLHPLDSAAIWKEVGLI